MQAQQALLRPPPGSLNVPQPLTTEVIQQYLVDNVVLITTILECINTGRVDDAVRFQQRLQQNLMWLAGIADTQPQPGGAAAAGPATPAAMVQPPPGQTQAAATGAEVVQAAQAAAAASMQAAPPSSDGVPVSMPVQQPP